MLGNSSGEEEENEVHRVSGNGIHLATRMRWGVVNEAGGNWVLSDWYTPLSFMAGTQMCWEWQLKSRRKSYCLDLQKNCLTLRLCSNSLASVHFCGINYINLDRAGNRISISLFYTDTDFPLTVQSCCRVIMASFLFVREYFAQLAWSHSVKQNVQNKLTEDLTYDNVYVIRRLQIFHVKWYISTFSQPWCYILHSVILINFHFASALKKNLWSAALWRNFEFKELKSF